MTVVASPYLQIRHRLMATNRRVSNPAAQGMESERLNVHDNTHAIGDLHFSGDVDFIPHVHVLHSNTLPLPRSPLVGRRRELAAVKQRCSYRSMLVCLPLPGRAGLARHGWLCKWRPI